MHRKPEGGLEHLLLPHPHAEREDQPRDVTRQLARQLHAAAFDEEVDDRELELVPARGGERGCARAHHLDAMSLTSEHHGQRAAAGDVAVYEENAFTASSHHSRPGQSKARTMARH
jgi:hypothetical protein